MAEIGSITLNKDVIKRLYDAIGRNSPADFFDLVAESHVDHSNGRNGPAGFVAAAANIHQAYSDFRIDLESLVAEGDWVVACWHETGVHTGQFFNLKPTHKPFESWGINAYRVTDGKISESWIAVDPRTIRAQQEAQRALSE
ncbi:ester cyclase [Bradyrhizobium sp. CCGB01]|uniref:ester cyclase n=1 Tax=Bradyrhizobium sp. CCGB01 TaxID=2949634 RepID=UPI0020B18A67|nr:ester cyclase [Bradyrhizobium sp. CCGB01]MCP3404752.1 ester cyclase [Bradyrhizobium sp. CCGB01]